MISEKEILLRLQATLSPERFRHTLSVSRWAQDLARRHGEDPSKAKWAGLLHDCAKEIPGATLASMVKRFGLAVPGKDFILRYKRFPLFHAYVSARLARNDYGVKDKTILNAIARHTLGADVMSRLDKILYVADFSAPQRDFSAASRVRRIARKDLDAAFREVLRLKLFYVLQSGEALHPQTVKLWNASLKG